LIDQFSICFFPTFLVSDKVVVKSKHNDNDQYIWKSEADKSFAIRKDESGDDIIHGTKVILCSKEDLDEFFEEKKIKDLI
jgi:HSP90 family molecular chaperone